MKQLFPRITLFLLSLLFCTAIYAQQQFKWVKGGGTTSGSTRSIDDEQVKCMCTDPNGNIYALSQVGYYGVTADTFHSTTFGDPENLVLTSYTCNGVMRWAKLLVTQTDNTTALGIAADKLGHIYVSGYFDHSSGLHTFYIGTDTSISIDPYLDKGLIQFDTSGNYKWIKFLGINTFASVSTMYGSGPLTVDASNNVHFLPYVKSGAPLATGVTSVYGVYDMTYDPSGNLLSAVRLDIDSQWEVYGAAIDSVTNKMYVYGEINQGIYGGFLTDTFYAAAFDASRNRLWQYYTNSAPGGGGSGLGGITLSPTKHLFFCGGSNATATFQFNGYSTAKPLGYGDMSIIMKTDSNGTVNWIKRFDSRLSVNAFTAITQLPNDKIAATGLFAGVVINGVVDSLVTPPSEGQNPYMVIVDSAGDVQALEQIHGDGFYDEGTAITSDKVGNVYIGGKVADTITAGSPPITSYHSVGGNTDFFVMKYGVDCSCTTMPLSFYTYSGTHTLGVTYTGTTVGLDSVVWNFGDLTATVKGTTATHTYAVADTYRVCATVYTTCGDDIYCSEVIISCGAAPVASFTDTGDHTVGVTYTGTTSTVDSTVWNFGDGSSTVKGATALHTYSAVGTYTVCVTAWSVCGNNTACKTVTVTCVSVPVVSFTHTGSYVIGMSYTGTTAGIDSIEWTFGDGGKGSGMTPSHTYTTIGTYTICATAYTHCGSGSSCSTITIPCVAAPTAAFTDTGRITLGTVYTGTTLAIDSVVWDFGDGSSKAKGTPALHTYTAAGTYHVCVTAYNPCGNNVFCLYDTIPCVAPPIASFSDTGSKIFGFKYTGTTTGIDSVVWNFGDGTGTMAGTPVLHTYTTSGTYHICVTAYTLCGIDSSCNDVVFSTLGLTSGNQPNIQVYPNPANDELTVTGVMESTIYRLLTVTGICVDHGVFYPGRNAVSMQQYAPGVYMLEMTGLDGQRNIVRVVKE